MRKFYNKTEKLIKAALMCALLLISGFALAQPTFTLTAPNGGQNFLAGSTQTISWVVSMPVMAVQLDLSTNGGVTWSSIAVAPGGTATTGSYAWTVPNSGSNFCLVRAYSGSTVGLGVSASVFTISGASGISLTAPSGIVWAANSVQNITWLNTVPLSTVNIDYTTNNGLTWSVVATNQPAGGMMGGFTWTVPNTPSGNCKVRVNAGGINTSTSTVNFTISGTPSGIVLTSPNGGQNWPVGSTQLITWNNLVVLSSVQIEYSQNAGLTWSSVVASTPAGGTSGTYSWVVPPTISSQCLVRLNAGGPHTATSVATFSISAPVSQLTVTAPNGGQNWAVGSSQVISWGVSTPIMSVSIEYSTNNGATYSTVIASTPSGGAGGTYNWTIPNTISSQCLVRVNGGGANVDVSNATFSISAPVSQLTVTAPNGGENWAVGSTQVVSWSTSTPITTVSIEYSINNGLTYSTVIASTPNGIVGGTYNWTIPNTISSQCLVRVNGGGANVDVSNATFTISAPVSQLTVTAPNGGENWAVGSTQTISWVNSTPITTVSIEYSINNGLTYSTVIASTPNGIVGGTYNWTIPNTISSQCLVRVNGGGANVDVSNATFTITSTIGLPKHTVNSDYAIAPNPFASTLKIYNTSTVSSVKISDLTGKTVYILNDITNLDSIDLDLNELNVGIYFLSITSNRNTTTKKIVKTN